LSEITFKSANALFSQKKYDEAVDQFRCLIDNNENPAFCSFLAGKCFDLLKQPEQAIPFFKKAVAYDDSNAVINREVERFFAANRLIPADKKIIWHYFPNTTNIGDSGSAAGIRSMLEGENLFFFTLSCRNDTMDVLKSYDTRASAVIIGGGGLFFRQPLASGWYFPLSYQEMTGLHVPVITYAVGLNREFSDDGVWNLDEAFIGRIAQFHKGFALKSVRDLWTKTSLEKAGVHDLSLVPCPSAFLKPLPWFNVGIDESSTIVGISITDRSFNNEGKSKLAAVFIAFARWLSQNNFFPLFILQDSADDLPLAKLIRQNSFPCILPNTAREAVSVYKKCSFVIGMRGHSLIIAAGQGIPVLGIAYNEKISAFMDLLDMQDYCINQNDIVGCGDLIKQFERLSSGKNELMSRLKLKRELFYTMNLHYTEKVVKVL